MSDPIKYDIVWLKSATKADLKAAMLIPEARTELNEVLRTREAATLVSDMLSDPDYVPVSKRQPEPEEVAAIEADTAIADQQAAAAAAEAQAEADRLAAAATPPEEKKKIVLDYQVTAEDGTPLGRRTHIEGWSWEEISEKQKDAHINAVRYAERVKKNKVQSIELVSQQKLAEDAAKKAEEEAAKAVEEAGKDPAALRTAISKVSKAERDAQIAEQTAKEQGKIIAGVWLEDHKDDFYNCTANINFIGEWLKENNREFTYENLELAFKAKEKQLVKPERQVPTEETPAAAASNTPAPASAPPTPVAAITAPVVSEAAPVSTPAQQPSRVVEAAPVSTSVAAPNAQPATRRPGVNGSLAPGALSAPRPSGEQKPVVSTYAEMRAEIAKMPREEYRRKLKSPQFVARMEAAGIRSVSQGT